jgi:hypothetical protein
MMNTVGILDSRSRDAINSEELVRVSEPVMSRDSISLRHSPRLRIQRLRESAYHNRYRDLKRSEVLYDEPCRYELCHVWMHNPSPTHHRNIFCASCIAWTFSTAVMFVMDRSAGCHTLQRPSPACEGLHGSDEWGTTFVEQRYRHL